MVSIALNSLPRFSSFNEIRCANPRVLYLMVRPAHLHPAGKLLLCSQVDFILNLYLYKAMYSYFIY